MAIDRVNNYAFLNDQSKPFRFYETENEIFGIGIDKNIVIDSANSSGIKLDLSAPTYGWRDMIGPVYVRSEPKIKHHHSTQHKDNQIWQMN